MDEFKQVTFVDQYPTGADVEVYRGSRSKSFALGPGEDLEPLDVSEIMITESGDVTPLYDFWRYRPQKFLYHKQLVTGDLKFNFSADYINKHKRRPIRGDTLWVVMTMVQYLPEPRIIRDTLRMVDVWSHPSEHTPSEGATENMGFTAHNIVLAGREQRIFSEGFLEDFARDDSVYARQSEDVFREIQSQYLGTVVSVTDGDTYEVRLHGNDGTQSETIPVRIILADTPETPGSPYKQNQDDHADYRWPSTAPSNRGTPGESPSSDQLDQWGLHATERVKSKLEGETVWLHADPAQPPTDGPQFNPLEDDPVLAPWQEEPEDGPRYLFHVSTMDGTFMAEWLVENGLAVPYSAASVTGADYVSRLSVVEEKHEEARELAGTNTAKGVWYSFDVSDWENR